MKINLKKSLLVSALGLTSTAVMAGNPNNGGGATAAQVAQINANKDAIAALPSTTPLVIGDAVGAKGVVGCLASTGGIKNLVVNIVDTPNGGCESTKGTKVSRDFKETLICIGQLPI